MLLERNQIGKREQLANVITRVDAKSKPILAMIPKGEAVTNMLQEYQVDDFEAPADIAVEDGKDAETFDNASANRALVQTYAMKVQDAAMVSDLAANVSDVAGLSGGERGQSAMKKIEKVSRCIECFLAGDQEHQAGGAGVPYKVRGLGVWIQNGAQATLPVPAAYRTPAASIFGTSVADTSEDEVNTVLESSYEQTGKEGNFDLVLGPKLKRRFSSMTRVDLGTNEYSTIRTYNTQFDGKIDNVVTQFEGDYGMINLHTSLWNAHANFGGSKDANVRRGYLLLMNLLSLHWKRPPRVRELEDRGGGPRFLVDGVFAFRVLNPLPLGKFNATT